MRERERKREIISLPNYYRNNHHQRVVRRALDSKIIHTIFDDLILS
jgi:hypothetical protein